ncbi:MAG: IS21 family transposase [Burkholderiales bacterium]
MPAPRVAMRRIREVLRLKLLCKLSHREIARALGVSVGAVSHYGQLAEQAGLAWPEVEAMDEWQIEARLMPRAAPVGRRLLPEFALVHQELKRKGVTLQLLWEEYVAGHPGETTYRYTQYCQRYADWAVSLQRSMRQVHRAGEKCFVDFAGPTVPIADVAGGVAHRAHIFVAVLGASNYTFACATAAESMSDWLGAMSLALEFYGGVPAMLVPDNPRALVAEADRYEPLANRTALDFAAHYATVILPARPYKPRDKAKVEVGVQVVERWILARLRHRRFFSLVELNAAIAELLAELNDRPFKKLPGSRRSAFEALDRPALRPLPATRYEVARFKPVRVNIDYHVEIERHYYSVPHALVRQGLEARITRQTVELLHRGRRVASHALSTKRGGYTTAPEHMPASHRAHAEWTPGRLLNWAARIGPAVAALVKHLLETKPHPEQGYRACLGLLAAARKYGDARLAAACERALAIGSPTRRSVLSILAAGLDQKPLSTEQAEWQLPLHENVRGPTYYH